MSTHVSLALKLGLGIVFTFSVAHLVNAESLALPTPPNSSVTLPGRGMTMEQVEAEFGVPLVKHDTVGKPPITQWEYSGFSVYFEHKWVIHAVGKRATPPQRQPVEQQKAAEPAPIAPAEAPVSEPTMESKPDQQGDITIPTEPISAPELDQTYPAPHR